jgi:hypothetical protein
VLSAFSQAWASWKKTPGIALLAVVAFAIGIGSATAIFTVINGVLLRPLPYPNAERFVALYSSNTNAPSSFLAMSVPELRDYQQQTTEDQPGAVWLLDIPVHPRDLKSIFL